MGNVFERALLGIKNIGGIPEAEKEKKKEIINRVASELEEKYGEYEDLKIFIQYLRSFEKIIINFSGDRKKLEEEYIGVEIDSLSAQSKISAELLASMRDNFKERLKEEIIKDLEHKILERCPDDIDDYRNFVEHLKCVYLIFDEKKKSNEKELKERLVEEKIKELSDDGEPTREELEKIHQDFRRKLIAENII